MYRTAVAVAPLLLLVLVSLTRPPPTVALREIAGRKSGWQLWDPTPKLTDVHQGELGNCYFLAGIAALAYRHPEIIRNAFVTDGELCGDGKRTVYVVRMMLDGEEKLVAVDDVVPMRKRGLSPPMYFANTNDGEDVWPLLLEKAFAKAMGSYLRIKGGIGFEAFEAIAQLPVVSFRVDNDTVTEQFWQFIKTAHDSKWPIVVGSRKDSEHTARSHAYVVMDLRDDGEKAVRLYNPWATRNKYTGRLRQNPTRGDFWIDLRELRASFDDAHAAMVIEGHKIITTRQIPAGAGETFKLRMTSDATFTVQLEWPSGRVLGHGCHYDKAETMLVVQKADDMKNVYKANASWRSNMRVQLPGAAGDYYIHVYASFEGVAVDYVVANVYAEGTEIGELSPVDLSEDELTAMQLHAAGLDVPQCRDIVWHSKRFMLQPGLLRECPNCLFQGSPFWKEQGGDSVFHLMQGQLHASPNYDEARRLGGSYYEFLRSDVKCVSEEMRKFDRCFNIFWKGRQFTKVDDFGGAPVWEFRNSADHVWITFQADQWAVVVPRDPARYYSQGSADFECHETELSEEELKEIGRQRVGLQGPGCDDIAWGGAHYKLQPQVFLGGPTWREQGGDKVVWVREKTLLASPSENEATKGVSYAASSFAASNVSCVSDEMKYFDRCATNAITWNGMSFLRKGSDFRGAPVWEHKGRRQEFWITFTDQWAVVVPNSPRQVYQKGREGITCQSGGSLAEVQAVHGEPMFAPIMVEPSRSVAQKFVEELVRHELRGQSLAATRAVDDEETLVPSTLEPSEHAADKLGSELLSREVRGRTPSFVQVANPCSSAAAALKRYRNLNNEDQILIDSEDMLFPPSENSVGSGGDCGDSAAGISSTCYKYNRWGSLTERFGHPLRV